MVLVKLLGGIMRVSQVSNVSFQSITPVKSTEAGFNALKNAAKEAGKSKYMLSDPNFMSGKEYGEKELYTRYLITGEDYAKYSRMPVGRKLYQAGVYDYNRAQVKITENSKSLIQKLIKRI